MRNFIAGAGLLTILNAIDLGHHQEETLYIRHVNSQEACDSFNIFDADRYEFNQEHCACFLREENYPGDIAECDAPRLTNPVDLDECITQCQIDEAKNHGLDANCNIPREGSAIHQHDRGFHKHRNENFDCNGRVVHNYKRVEVAPLAGFPDYQQYIDIYNMNDTDLDFTAVDQMQFDMGEDAALEDAEHAAEASDAEEEAGVEAPADEIVQDATESDSGAETGAEVDSDAQSDQESDAGDDAGDDQGEVAEPEAEIVQDATGADESAEDADAGAEADAEADAGVAPETSAFYEQYLNSLTDNLTEFEYNYATGYTARAAEIEAEQQAEEQSESDQETESEGQDEQQNGDATDDNNNAAVMDTEADPLDEVPDFLRNSFF